MKITLMSLGQQCLLFVLAIQQSGNRILSEKIVCNSLQIVVDAIVSEREEDLSGNNRESLRFLD